MSASHDSRVRPRPFTQVDVFGAGPFAGHPTLGTAAAWLLAGGRPRTSGTVVQECAAGLVDVRIESAPHLLPDDGPVPSADRRTGGAPSPLRLAFRAPALTRDEEPTAADLDAALQVAGLQREDVVAARWTDNGPGWPSQLLKDVETLRAVRPRPSVDGSPVKVGLCALTGADAPDGDHRLSVPFEAGQGAAVGRDGRVRVTADEAGDFWIGGDVTVGVRGESLA